MSSEQPSIDAFQEESDEVEARLAKQLTSNKSLNDEVSDLRQQLRHTAEQDHRARESVDVLEQENSTLRSNLMTSEASKSQTEKNLRDATLTLRSNEKHIAAIESENTRLVQENARLVQSTNLKDREAGQANTKLREELQKGAERKKEVSRLCAIIDELRSEQARGSSVPQPEQFTATLAGHVQGARSDVGRLPEVQKPEQEDDTVENIGETKVEGKKRRRTYHRKKKDAAGASEAPIASGISSEPVNSGDVTELGSPVLVEPVTGAIQPEKRQYVAATTQTDMATPAMEPPKPAFANGETQTDMAAPATEPLKPAYADGEMQTDMAAPATEPPKPAYANSEMQTEPVPAAVQPAQRGLSKVSKALLVVFLGFCLVAFYWSVRTAMYATWERNMWLDCNDISRRATIYITNESTGGRRVGWLWEKRLLELDTNPVGFKEMRARQGAYVTY